MTVSEYSEEGGTFPVQGQSGSERVICFTSATVGVLLIGKTDGSRETYTVGESTTGWNSTVFEVIE